jgi:hypothetical protein
LSAHFEPFLRRRSSAAGRSEDALRLELAADHRCDPDAVLNTLHLDVDPVPPRSENLTGRGLALKRLVIRHLDGAFERPRC